MKNAGTAIAYDRFRKVDLISNLKWNGGAYCAKCIIFKTEEIIVILKQTC